LLAMFDSLFDGMRHLQLLLAHAIAGDGIGKGAVIGKNEV
jgi:hypothetical protein